MSHAALESTITSAFEARDGVSAEVIFPTFALQACFASEDAQFQRALCRAYNSWAAEVFDDPRLLAVGLVAMLDIVDTNDALGATYGSARSASTNRAHIVQ